MVSGVMFYKGFAGYYDSWPIYGSEKDVEGLRRELSFWIKADCGSSEIECVISNSEDGIRGLVKKMGPILSEMNEELIFLPEARRRIAEVISHNF